MVTGQTGPIGQNVARLAEMEIKPKRGHAPTLLLILVETIVVAQIQRLQP